MCATNSSDYIRKLALAANCALMLACSTSLYGNLMYLDDILMIPSHTAGMARFRVDQHTPDRSVSSLWKAPVSRNPRAVSSCVGTDKPWLLAVFHSRAGRSSVHSSSNTGLGNLKRLMSQLLSFANRSCHSLNTLSHLILPFVMFSNKAKAAIVNAIFSSVCACFYIHPYDCKRVCVNCPLMCL